MKLTGYSSDSVEPYFHNYLFPHDEKRCYRNKLKLVGENVVYLGVTLKDKTDRHWNVPTQTIQVRRTTRLGKSYYQFDINGKTTYAKTIGEIRSEVEHGTTIEFLKPDKPNYCGLSIPAPVEKVGTKTFHKLSNYQKWCCYCECELTEDNFTKEHLLPKDKGGKGVGINHWNIRPCCRTCNTEKDNLLLREYIGMLNILSCNQNPNSKEYSISQIKIKNANKLAKEIAKYN